MDFEWNYQTVHILVSIKKNGGENKTSLPSLSSFSHWDNGLNIGHCPLRVQEVFVISVVGDAETSFLGASPLWERSNRISLSKCRTSLISLVTESVEQHPDYSATPTMRTLHRFIRPSMSSVFSLRLASSVLSSVTITCSAVTSPDQVDKPPSMSLMVAFMLSMSERMAAVLLAISDLTSFSSFFNEIKVVSESIL